MKACSPMPLRGLLDGRGRKTVDTSRHTVRLHEFLCTLYIRSGDFIGTAQVWSN